MSVYLKEEYMNKLFPIVLALMCFGFSQRNDDMYFLKFTDNNTTEVNYTNWSNLKEAYNFKEPLLDREDYNDVRETIIEQAFISQIVNLIYEKEILKMDSSHLFYDFLEFVDWEATIFTKDSNRQIVFGVDVTYNMDKLRLFFNNNFHYVDSRRDYSIYQIKSDYTLLHSARFFLVNFKDNIVVFLDSSNQCVESIDRFYNNTKYFSSKINDNFISIVKNFTPPLSFILLSDESKLYQMSEGPYSRQVSQLKTMSQMQENSKEISQDILQKLKKKYARDPNIIREIKDSKALAFGYNIKNYSKSQESSHIKINTRIISSFKNSTKINSSLRLKIYDDLSSYKWREPLKDILPINDCSEVRNLWICDFASDVDGRVLLHSYYSQDNIFDIFARYRD
tara:strand:+ start:379 stop:1563 length:1185 start_codon:yes stop_codon:yes gene_type:complete